MQTYGHGHHSNGHQFPLTELEAAPQTWLEKYGKQIDQPFSGPLAARFGPYAIRSGSRRQRDARGYTMSWGNNPYSFGSKIVDCGDVPVNPFDNALAVDQMEVAYSTLLSRPTLAKSGLSTQNLALDGVDHPRILTETSSQSGVIHFDAHLSKVTHGTFFYLAQEEGLISNTSIHAGIRCKLGLSGFQLITTDDIDDLGVSEIIRLIRERVGSSPVYLSLDIDVIDPGIAPASALEVGRLANSKRIIRGLAGLNFVGADLVEVSPAYDVAEVTAVAAAELVHDFLSMFLSDKPPSSRSRRAPARDEL
ncbi:Arginase/deacetylase [Mycena olivaceomarginata]|nr:Arginase/deacetylase [Mycena olivaceomarginata]